jgi:hypothetical protein
MIFDGKVLLHPFVEQTPALRNSKNRRAGTLVTRPVKVKASDLEGLHRALTAGHQIFGDLRENQ